MTETNDDKELLKQLHINIIDFFDELISLFPRDNELIFMRIFLKDQIEIKEIMSNLNWKLNTNDQKLKKLIKERDESTFIDNDIFHFENKSINFKKLWNSNRLDLEDKENIWKWMDSFIFLCSKYCKKSFS
jgi:hypothetical protein